MVTLKLVVFLLLLCATGSSAAFPDFGTASADELVEELQLLRSRSLSGVIRLDEAAVSRFITSPPASSRPYSILIFFDATSLHSKPELQLQALRRQFALVSSSFLAANAELPRALSSVFFADIEYSQAPNAFAAFGVTTVPHVRLVPAGAASPRDNSVVMDQSHFARPESIAEFVESHTGVTVGPIQYPPLLTKVQLIALGIILAVAFPFVAKRILTSDTPLHDAKMWAAGAIFVYFFSAGGSMYGIIRSTPLFMADRANPQKLIFFYQGSGMQLGAEGFTVGAMYTAVGLMVAAATQGLVRVRNTSAQRVGMLVVMAAGWWAVRKVIQLDNWKTGYHVHSFWPTRWR